MNLRQPARKGANSVGETRKMREVTSYIRGNLFHSKEVFVLAKGGKQITAVQ